MQPSDKAAVLALWQRERGESEEFAANAVEHFAGQQNVYVAEENDAIAAVALAVPVTLQGRQGSYLYGLCGQGSLILAGLLDYLCAQQKLRGAGFTVAVPATPEQAALLQDKGFARAFALRCLPREVARNLWSQAEFDSVTAKKLCELREKFWPDTVQFTPERMAVVLGDLYSRGATIVAITDNMLSPVYQLSDAALLAPCEMISFVDSMVAPLSLVNALLIAVGYRLGTDVSRTFAELEDIWNAYGVFGKVDDE